LIIKALISVAITGIFWCIAFGISHLNRLLLITSNLEGIITYAIVIALCLLFGFTLMKDRGFAMQFNSRKKNAKYILIGIIGGLLISVISTSIMYSARLHIDFGFLSQSTTLVILTLLLFAPICEELLFRGIILTFLANSTNNSTQKRKNQLFSFSVVFSAFLFGISHLIWVNNGNANASILVVVVTAFVLGIFSGFLRLKTGEILPSFIAHASFNFLGASSVVLIIFINAATPHPYDIENFHYNFDLNNPSAFDSSINVYVERNLIYPQQAKLINLSGSVVVEFTINEDGYIEDVHVDSTCRDCKHLGYGCEEEAVRVIKSLPVVKPRIVNGRPEKTDMSYQIPFY
jgi:TonB family protein